MLYHWLAPLGKTHIIFNLFNYISFRAAGATVTALLLAFVVGPAVIRRLRARKVGQVIRAEGPASHQSKRGTPDDGRAHHPARDHRPDAALGAAHQPVRRRGDAVDPLDGLHRVPRRLPEDRPGQVARAGGQVEAGGAGELRGRAGRLPRHQPSRLHRDDPGHGHDAAVLQVSGRQLRALALRGVRDRGHHRKQQRGEPHRRPRRARDRARRDLRGRLRRLRLPVRPGRRDDVPQPLLPARRGRARGLLRGAHGRHARLPLVQRASGPGVHG